MSAHSIPGQEGDPAAEQWSNSPGRRLRVARQALGLDLERVAAELRLSDAIVQSLERDDYDALPGQVFVVGYIRKYARVVGLDPEPLVVAYQAGMERSEPARSQARAGEPAVGRSGGRRFVSRLIGFGMLILLTALMLVWWQRRERGIEAINAVPDVGMEAGTMVEPVTEIREPALAGRDSIAAGAAEQPSEMERRGQSSTPEPPPDPIPSEPPPMVVAPTGQAVANDADDRVIAAVDMQPSATEQPTEEPVSVEEDGGQGAGTASREIVMSFDGPCWVDVRDSERKYKLFGEMKKGDRHVLGGKPPYSVILGNAAAVRVTVGGEAFDLSKMSQGNVARFTLDPEMDQEPSAEGRGSPSSALGSTP